MGGWGSITKSPEGTFWDRWTVQYFVVVATGLLMFAETRRPVYLRRVIFTACKLYLNKPDLLKSHYTSTWRSYHIKTSVPALDFPLSLWRMKGKISRGASVIVILGKSICSLLCAFRTLAFPLLILFRALANVIYPTLSLSLPPSLPTYPSICGIMMACQLVKPLLNTAPQ